MPPESAVAEAPAVEETDEERNNRLDDEFAEGQGTDEPDEQLSRFEGKRVTEVGIEIRNVAGGLQDAVKFTPVEWQQGDEHFIVLRCLVKEIDHEPVDKDDYAGDQRRVHVLHAAEAFPIAASYVQEAVDAKRAEIKKLKDEAKGTPALDLDGVNDPHRHRNDDLGDELSGDGAQ